MFPDSVLMCDVIFLFNLFVLIFIYNKKVSHRVGIKVTNGLYFLSMLLFLFGTVLNVVQVIIRYWYREIGYYQELWHMGMVCFYLSIVMVFIWMIVFIHYETKKNKVEG